IAADVAPAAAATMSNSIRDKPITGGQPIVVTPGLFVINLAAVNEAEETFQITGYLSMNWRDERLASPNDARQWREYKRDDIWMPQVEISNATSYRRDSYLLMASRDGSVHYTERFDATLSDYY